MKKKRSFALMNVLIKGTAISIQNALAKLEPNTFVLKEFTYNSKSVDASDSTIVKAGVVFEKWYKVFITPDEIPFASMTEIKFIGLGNGRDGNGRDGYRSDGSYVFYKDFGESSVSECYRFSYISPMQEEFDAQWDVLDNVRNSFMDRTWKYRYEDYSCGEYCPWSFNSKKDKALILKWKSDEKDD